MQKIKKGDEVYILTGKDKGRRGKILTVLKIGKHVARVVVEGVNMIKKHMAPNPQKNQQGGILEKEAPIHVSNVALFNSTTGKSDRVGFRILEDGRKVRYFKSNDDMVDI